MDEMKEDKSENSESEESEQSSSSDEDEEEVRKNLENVLEEDFFKTLSSLKRKDPKIYDGSVKFFKNEEKPKVKKKTEKPLYLSDYERKFLLEKGGVVSDEEDAPVVPTKVEEERRLKEEFKNILNESSDEEDEGLLKPHKKTKKEKETEEVEYVAWLKGQKDKMEDEEAESELKTLHDYWNNPQLDEGEQFLKDYILNKRFLEKEDEPLEDEDLSEDERALEEQAEFEETYNFRYEDAEKDNQRHPRVIEGSLRKKQEKRKKKRAERRERKMAEKAKKQKAILEQQKKKRKEIEEKLKELKEITGNEQLGVSDQDVFQDEPQEYQEGELNMDCDAPKKESRSKKKKKLLKKKTAKDAINLMPSFLNISDEPYKEYVDELYEMDCEDFIDDIPCKFKYKTCVPNDFGLSVEEILMADDKELDKWCSIQKIYKQRSEHVEKNEINIYKQKAADIDLKMKILPSLFKTEEPEEEGEEEEGTSQQPKPKKKKKKGAKQNVTTEPEEVNTQPEEKQNPEAPEVVKERPKKRSFGSAFPKPKEKNFKRNKLNKGSGGNKSGLNIDAGRLKAYGMKPSKFKKKFS